MELLDGEAERMLVEVTLAHTLNNVLTNLHADLVGADTERAAGGQLPAPGILAGGRQQESSYAPAAMGATALNSRCIPSKARNRTATSGVPKPTQYSAS